MNRFDSIFFILMALLAVVMFLSPPSSGGEGARGACSVGVSVSVSSSDKEQAEILDVIWELESGMAQHGTIGDGGKALGPYQIHKDYWKDAVEHDPGLGINYLRCNDHLYSRKIVVAYMERWVPEAWSAGDAEVILRTHNGGPRGATKESTLEYWAKGKELLR